MNELALFAGAGGGILGGHLLGWRTVCAVELEPYPACVLCQRQNDGLLPPFPVWDDVRTFDGHPWRGIVDVVSGGFPCQDISAAGKGVGIEGERSGLWREMHRVICEVRPRYAFMENSPMLTSRGLDAVQRDLAESGYDAEWIVLGADDAGAPHVRKRIWILALDTHANCLQCPEHRSEHPRPQIPAGGSPHGLDAGASMADTQSAGFPPIRPAIGYEAEHTLPTRGGADVADPNGERQQQPSGDFPEIGGRACHSGEEMADTHLLGLCTGGEKLLPHAGDGLPCTVDATHGGEAVIPANTHLPGCEKQRVNQSASEELATAECGHWWALNPVWVEWLMGWPPGWTALKSWGTGKFRRWQRWHSAFCENA